MEKSFNEKYNNINNNNSINSSLSNSSSSADDEDENNLYDDYQGPYTYPSDDMNMINKEIQIKENNIIKIIKEVGQSLYKPKEKDNIIFKCDSFYINKSNNNELIILDKFCNFREDKEYNLNDKYIPRSLSLAICSMRIGELSLIKIKFNYIFKFLDIDKKNDKKYLNLVPKEFYDDHFRKLYFNEKICFNVKLINYFQILNLTDKGEIKKKIIYKNNNDKENINENEENHFNNNTKVKHPVDSDIVTINLKCIYNNQEIYNYINKTFELDKSYLNEDLLDIELYVIKNTKINEYNCFLVEIPYLLNKNKKFKEKYPLFLKASLSNISKNDENNNIIEFYCEIKYIEHYDYIYKYKNNNDIYSKSKTLHKGFGLACPDNEMYTKFKLQIKIDNIIKFNSFNNIDNIEKDYINNEEKINEMIEWRDKMNKEFDINYLDQEIDYIKSEKIFEKLNFDGLLTSDMNDYLYPSVIRQVINTMKRNEIKYIKCTYIDYLKIDDLELYDIKNNNIEIYIHLYDFREMPLFGKYSYEDKYKIISHYKEIADNCFKNSKNNKRELYRAMKIYNKLKHRFSGGDVFGHDREEAEKYLKKINNDLYNKLYTLRINIYNNLSVTLMKLEKINKCYLTSKQVLDLFDNKNIKALYLYGKACLLMKYYSNALDTFKKIKEIQPDNKEIEKDLREAEEKYNNNISSQHNLYKKMFRGNN